MTENQMHHLVYLAAFTARHSPYSDIRLIPVALGKLVNIAQSLRKRYDAHIFTGRTKELEAKATEIAQTICASVRCEWQHSETIFIILPNARFEGILQK